MALNLPNIPKVKALAAKTTPGSKTGASIAGVKVPKNPFATAPKKAAAKKAPSLGNQFTMGLPYDPSQISQTAQSQYASDVADRTKLAGMGYQTNAQIGSDFAARGAASNAVYADLAARLAGVQNATVAQGNAGAAGLAQQNAAAASSGGNIAGAPAAPAIPTSAATAVLGSQTAAAGNYGGDLQRAAYSSGVQANQKALDAGTVAQQDNSNNVQRTLASLLSGLPTESAREGTMLGANTQTDAANKQTLLTLYQNGVNQQYQYAALGEKGKENAQSLANQRLLAEINQTGSNYRTGLTTATSAANAAAGNRSREQIAKDNAAARVAAAKAKGATGGTASASSRRQALNQAIKIINTTGGTKTTSTAPVTYTVKIQATTASGAANPLSQPTSVTIPAAQAKTYKPPKGYIALGAPAVAKTSSTSKTVDKPGSYTKYNRAASYLKAQGWSQAEIKSALKQYHP